MLYELTILKMLPFLGRISGLEEDLKNGKLLVSKIEVEKRQLQERLADLEKVKSTFMCKKIIIELQIRKVALK